MARPALGVAVIGAGMAGRAHAAGYRSATTPFASDLPDVRLVAIADANEAVATATARRYGYERAESTWQAIADAPDIDVVSVVVANHLHREIVEGLLAAGKHVLCEKPLAPTVEDAEAMVAAAQAPGPADRRRLHLPPPARRSPRSASRSSTARSGRRSHFNGHYWCDYAADAERADELALQGRPRARARSPTSAATCIDLAEFVCGPIDVRQRRGLHDRRSPSAPLPLGTAVGHAAAELSATCASRSRTRTSPPSPRTFASGAAGTFSVSRVALGPAELARLRALHAEPARRRSTWTGPASSASPTGSCRRATSGLPPGARSGPPTRTSPAACRWTSRASATARTTCSASRRARSSSRSPGCDGRPCHGRVASSDGLHNLRLLEPPSSPRSRRRRRRRRRPITVRPDPATACRRDTRHTPLDH